MTRYRWVHHGGGRLHDVGILADGALHNPRGYPEDVVRAAVLAADERLRERRSQSAKKAAVTRRRHAERKIYDVAKRIVEGHTFGPAPNCVLCGRWLDDPQSVKRGIGSECWQGVLMAIQVRRSA